MFLHKEIEAELAAEQSTATRDGTDLFQRPDWRAMSDFDTGAAVVRGRRLQGRAIGDLIARLFAPSDHLHEAHRMFMDVDTNAVVALGRRLQARAIGAFFGKLVQPVDETNLQSETDRYVARGQQLQAIAVGNFLTPLFRPITVPLRAVFKAVARYLRMLNAVDELRALDDRMLADIGISRSEIQYTVRQSFKAETAESGFWTFAEGIRGNSANSALRAPLASPRTVEQRQENVVSRAFWALSRLAAHSHANDPLRGVDPDVVADLGVASASARATRSDTSTRPAANVDGGAHGPIPHAA